MQEWLLLEIAGAGAALVAVGAGVAALRRRRARLALAAEEAEAPAGDAAAADAGRPGGLAAVFFRGLARSREAFARGLAAWGGGADEEALQALEDALISADIGARASASIIDAVRRDLRRARDRDPREVLRAQMLQRLGEPAPLARVETPPLVVLVVGVNGSGKTTTIGKLAARYRREGRTVLLAAADTFRAGAIEQLKVWGERAGVPVVAHAAGADPAAVAHDAVAAARARGIDVVICDTAGRLQAARPLMDELGKLIRVIRRQVPEAPHEVLLVLDATIGQNALAQARAFKEVAGVTGVVLTKLDGTARGGVVVAVREETGLPVKLVGLGEGLEDLRDFDPEAFVDALLGDGGEDAGMRSAGPGATVAP